VLNKPADMLLHLVSDKATSFRTFASLPERLQAGSAEAHLRLIS
jgi:hypothetical protein